jgi:hypothetical protein
MRFSLDSGQRPKDGVDACESVKASAFGRRRRKVVGDLRYRRAQERRAGVSDQHCYNMVPMYSVRRIWRIVRISNSRAQLRVGGDSTRK